MMEQLTETVFNDGIAQLAQSSRDLAARFGQQRTVAGQLALIREELAEVLTAKDDAHRVEELCDLAVVWAGLCDAYGFPDSRLHIPKGYLRFGPHILSPALFKWEMDGVLKMLRFYPNGGMGVLGQLNRGWIVIHWILEQPQLAELFPAQVAVVVVKNEEKTADSHYLNPATNKITRKAVQS